MMACLNKPQDFRLVIVRVADGKADSPIYIKEPFDQEPGFAQISATFSINELLKNSI